MIGIDIVEISRIASIKNKFGKQFLNKVFNVEEQSLIKSNETLAGFYAAKEAFSKAIGTGIGKECSFHDIIINKTEKNAPYIELKDKIKDNFNIKKIGLSISHDGNFAIAAIIIDNK